MQIPTALVKNASAVNAIVNLNKGLIYSPLFVNFKKSMTEKIWQDFAEPIYFFILKRVKNKELSNDILQEVFIKIHKNIHQLKDESKLKSWIFQITRNEIVNFFEKENKYTTLPEKIQEENDSIPLNNCCFDKFINDLPELYKIPIEMIYIEGKKQNQVANELKITLSNVKIRLKRAKEILKGKLKDCCEYQVDKNGFLVGEADCSTCDS
ncbi:MAG: sigma-70 family RNA polymerase sigma factor [Capnocytophaga sp.]|nr:sigma-70 family RNA polymerase sigma factor [Capnocytophaga sp.]